MNNNLIMNTFLPGEFEQHLQPWPLRPHFVEVNLHYGLSKAGHFLAAVATVVIEDFVDEVTFAKRFGLGKLF